MASTNQSPIYQKAEARFLGAQTDKEKLSALEEMIKECPKHKSAEKMLANLKTRYKKLREKIKRIKKIGKTSKPGIKKEEMQAVIIGKTNSGKSSLLSVLTNAKPEISKSELAKFTTKLPVIGIMDYQGVQIQLIESPAIEPEYTKKSKIFGAPKTKSFHGFDKGVVNSADIILILTDNIEDMEKINKNVEKSEEKKIIIFNKIDLLTNEQKRKISTFLQSKKLNFILVSIKTGEGISELKNKIFKRFNKIRVYTKEPKKNQSEKPVILNDGSSLKDVAEKIFHGFSKNIKEARITGPSSKFPNQVVSMNHILKDKDIVEFKMK